MRLNDVNKNYQTNYRIINNIYYSRIKILARLFNKLFLVKNKLK